MPASSRSHSTSNPTSQAVGSSERFSHESILSEPSNDDDMEFGLDMEYTEEDHEGDQREGSTTSSTGDDESEMSDAETDDRRARSPQTPPQPTRAGARELIRLLRQRGFHIRSRDLADDSDDYEPEAHRVGASSNRHRHKRYRVAELPPVPNPEGRKLMDAGVFGSSRNDLASVRQRSQRLAEKLVYRELGLGQGYAGISACRYSQELIPSSKADKIIHYSSRCYSGQFSDDGNFFFSCAQDFKVRMYDTSNPYDWKYHKTVLYPYGQWTITDATLSPDNRYLAYSSIRSTVCLSLTDPSNRTDPWQLDLANIGGGRRQQPWQSFSNFGIWSVRFSGDGRELVAGTSGPSVCVYDIERRQTIINIDDGHMEDVNAVCFGDNSSPHILYSGSDDTLLKVWDRRSLGDKRAAGVFMGHTEGLTYVDSKGDGRYILSNGKDQTMRLWDLRKMMSTEKASRINPQHFSTGFDYRFMAYGDDQYVSHPHDCSVVIYRGHSVLKTLIRCHFSPQGSSNSRYVYSGSEDGSVYIYNIDATLAGKIDVNGGTQHSRPCDPEDLSQYALDDRRDRYAWKTCVRDASWHPAVPMIAATSWNGWGMSSGTCSTHSWNNGSNTDEGFPAMGQSVDQRLVPDREDQETTSGGRTVDGQDDRPWRNRLRSRRVPAADET